MKDFDADFEKYDDALRRKVALINERRAELSNLYIRGQLTDDDLKGLKNAIGKLNAAARDMGCKKYEKREIQILPG